MSRTVPVSSEFGTDRGLPIDRYYIEKFLKKNKKHIKGRILEIAEDTYSRKFADYSSSKEPVFETMHYDGKETNSTIIGDLTNLENLPVDRYDCFICTQTYNFIFDVQKAIKGSFQLLKPGGIVLATVGGISQISRYDMDRWGDYWRFTDKSISRLFKNAGFSKVGVVTMGNSLAASGFLQGLVVEDFPERKKLDEKDEDYQMIIGVSAIK
ncbi:MAG: class I SAM-dependent methyltransferase [Bacteroidales bacterium]|nr:class I SAM-dependent methyltransferase [Bacteroidales bacterium]